MNSKKYVLEHDYGYGREPELKSLNKLELRNILDLEVYVEDLINDLFEDDIKDLIKVSLVS